MIQISYISRAAEPMSAVALLGLLEHSLSSNANDRRHKDVQVLRCTEVSGRQYSDWTMGFERVTEHGLRDIEGLRDFGEQDFNFDFLAQHGEVVETLMNHFRAPHWDPLVRELDAKDKVIEHLKRSLAQARSRAEMASLVLESVTDAGRKGGISEAHLRLCESTLNSLRAPLPDAATSTATSG